jgi:hypothetical protein
MPDMHGKKIVECSSSYVEKAIAHQYDAERCEYDIRCTECGWDVPIPEAVLHDFEREVLRKIIDRVLDRMYEIRSSDDE